MADKKLSEFEAMGYDNSTPVMIPAVRYSSSEAGATKENRNIPLNLFYQPSFMKYEWDDKIRNETCWLRCDTFSWHSGDSQYANSYENVYNHLVDDIDGKSLTSETIAGITIQYYLADDGHKVCPATEESNVLSLYNTVGIAWYYILDTENIRFKLPRTKFGFTGLRDSVGNYVPETLPNIRGQIRGWLHYRGGSDTGALYADNTLEETITGHNNYTSTWSRHPTLDASRSSSVYQDNAPVQSRATQMYLYCYVGKFSQSAVENIAGEHTELFNDKVDIDLKNVDLLSGADAIIDRQEPNAENNYTWYQLYASGRVRQGGYKVVNSASVAAGTYSTATVNFPIAITPYTWKCQARHDRFNSGFTIGDLTTKISSATIYQVNDSSSVSFANPFVLWEIEGMADLT